MIFLVLLMYALFASVFTVGKYTLQFVDPYFLTGVRMLLAGLILLPFCKSYALKWKLVPLIIGLAFFNVFITNAFEFWALQYLQTAKASLIYSFAPLFAILLSYVLFKEKMSAIKWLGLGIGFAGFLPIALQPGDFGAFSRPEFAIMVSSLTSVIGWLIMKRLMFKHNYSFLTANTYSFLIAGVFSLIAAYFLDSPTPIREWKPFLMGLIYITVIHNVICYNIYCRGLTRFSVALMSFAGFSNPLFTAIYGYFFLDEKVNTAFFFSLFLVFIGIFIYSRAETKRVETG